MTLSGASFTDGFGPYAGHIYVVDGAGSTAEPEPQPDAEPEPEPGALSLDTPFTAGAIVIDGQLGEYAAAPAVTMRDSGRGADDNTATVRTLWDATHLYIAYDVADTKVNATATAAGAGAWRDDNMEIFIDRSNDHGAWRGADDFHFFVNVRNVRDDGGSGFGTSFPSAATVVGTVDNDTDTDTGYRIEVAVPWASIGGAPQAGTRIGIDFAAADRDDATYQFYDWANLALFAEPARWGDIVLLAATAADPDPAPCLPVTEICDNGFDDDCDGAADAADANCTPDCADADGDGHRPRTCGGTDCNDTNAADVLDQDCSGADAICVLEREPACDPDVDPNCYGASDTATCVETADGAQECDVNVTVEGDFTGCSAARPNVAVLTVAGMALLWRRRRSI